jgi:hypothetical protein
MGNKPCKIQNNENEKKTTTTLSITTHPNGEKMMWFPGYKIKEIKITEIDKIMRQGYRHAEGIFRNRDAKLAAEFFKRVTELDPNHNDACMNLALLGHIKFISKVTRFYHDITPKFTPPDGFDVMTFSFEKKLLDKLIMHIKSTAAIEKYLKIDNCLNKCIHDYLISNKPYSRHNWLKFVSCDKNKYHFEYHNYYRIPSDDFCQCHSSESKKFNTIENHFRDNEVKIYRDAMAKGVEIKDPRWMRLCGINNKDVKMLMEAYSLDQQLIDIPVECHKIGGDMKHLENVTPSHKHSNYIVDVFLKTFDMDRHIWTQHLQVCSSKYRQIKKFEEGNIGDDLFEKLRAIPDRFGNYEKIRPIELIGYATFMRPKLFLDLIENYVKTTGDENIYMLMCAVHSGAFIINRRACKKKENGELKESFALFKQASEIKTSIDISDMFYWLTKKLCAYKPAIYNLGVCYYNGHGCEKNLKEAFRLFKLSGRQMPTEQLGIEIV